MTKPFLLTAAIAAALLLGGCGDEAPSDAELYRLSCTGLAREIGKFSQKRADAQEDSIVGTVDMILADNREAEVAAGINSISGDIEGANAERELNRLQSVYQARGCY